MELHDPLEALRTRYGVEFRAAHAGQLHRFAELYPEITVQMSGGTFRNLMTIDMVGRDARGEHAIEVGTTQAAYAAPFTAEYAGMNLSFESVSWDAIAFVPDPALGSLSGFGGWFERWMDAEGLRPRTDPLLSGVIHSVTFEDGVIGVDFGSAPLEAMIEMFDILSALGVQRVTVRSAR